MRRCRNAFRTISIGVLVAATMALVAGCEGTATIGSVGPGTDTTGRAVNGGAEAAMATEPSPVSPSAPVSPRVATPAIFSPGPTASIE